MKNSLLYVLLALGCCIAPLHAGTIVLTSPGSATGMFDVFVDVSDVFAPPHDTEDALLGYGFNVIYDTSVLSYLGETPGALFDDLSGQPGLTAQVAGVATGILLLPGDFIEPLRLVTLHFTLAGQGNFGVTSIGITGDPSNLDQGLIYLSASDAIDAGTSLAASPEPGTWMTAAFAIAAIGILRRRRLVR